MSWRRSLELELELAVAEALMGGPATAAAARDAERNMRAVLDRWLGAGQMPGISGYHLSVSGGQGLEVDLRFEEKKTVQVVNIGLDKR